MRPSKPSAEQKQMQEISTQWIIDIAAWRHLNLLCWARNVRATDSVGWLTALGNVQCQDFSHHNVHRLCVWTRLSGRIRFRSAHMVTSSVLAPGLQSSCHLIFFPLPCYHGDATHSPIIPFTRELYPDTTPVIFLTEFHGLPSLPWSLLSELQALRIVAFWSVVCALGLGSLTTEHVCKGRVEKVMLTLEDSVMLSAWVYHCWLNLLRN